MIVYTRVSYFLGGGATRFQSQIGVDDAAGSFGTVIFRVYADGVKIYDSGLMTTAMTPQSIDVDLTGRNVLTLEAVNGVAGAINGYADWANPQITVPALPPAVPGGLSAAPTAAQFNLDWYQSYGADSYYLKRSLTSGSGYTNLANVVAPGFTDTNVASGTLIIMWSRRRIVTARV